jgi:putative transposase
MTQPSVRKKVVELIVEAVKSGARLFIACEEAEISSRTYNRWVKSYNKNNEYVDKRTIAIHPEPHNKLSSEEKQEILNVVNLPEFSSLPPSQIVPILADRGIYIASESSFYRVLREHNAQHHRGRSKEPIKRRATTHAATAPNRVYTWDITYLSGPIKGTHYYLYMISDLFSRKIVAWEVWEIESAENASELIRRAVIAEKLTTRENPLVLHSDNGSPMKGATMLETLYNLGITPSRSRPRVSNDNPFAESLFKTLKYRCNYQPKGFASLKEARTWVYNFVDWYNNNHRHSGINFLTPNQRHSADHGLSVLAKRDLVYKSAKLMNPNRWTRDTRDWSIVDKVWLNPEKTEAPVETNLEARSVS